MNEIADSYVHVPNNQKLLDMIEQKKQLENDLYKEAYNYMDSVSRFCADHGEKLLAIKALRMNRNAQFNDRIGLKEAKDIVEVYMSRKIVNKLPE